MRYVYRDGQLVEARYAPPLPRGPRSGLPSPAIRPDGMGDTLNPANGLLYDSRSAYERAVKDAGCVIVGDDKSYSNPSPRSESELGHVERDIKDAIEQLGGS